MPKRPSAPVFVPVADVAVDFHRLHTKVSKALTLTRALSFPLTLKLSLTGTLTLILIP